MRNSVKAVLERLKNIQREVEAYLNDVPEGDSEREERLSNEVDSLSAAIEALEEIE